MMTSLLLNKGLRLNSDSKLLIKTNECITQGNLGIPKRLVNQEHSSISMSSIKKMAFEAKVPKRKHFSPDASYY